MNQRRAFPSNHPDHPNHPRHNAWARSRTGMVGPFPRVSGDGTILTQNWWVERKWYALGGAACLAGAIYWFATRDDG